MNETRGVTKLLIDTDPGIDDVMAIFYALSEPSLEVVGLTSIFGNAHTEVTTRNALKLLEIAGRTDIPVARGVDAPLAMPYRGPVPFVHGDDGMGNTHLGAPETTVVAATAAEFIVETIMSSPGEITLVPLGPLTNIALALEAEPGLAGATNGVVLMGGNAFTGGNATPGAEANIVNDPEAADAVFAAQWDIVMAGLDVTELTLMTNADLACYAAAAERLTETNPQIAAMAAHVAAITPHYSEFYRARLGLDGIHVHDSTCISYLIAPEMYTWVEHPICVDTGNSVCRGKTLPALHGVTDRATAWAGRRDVRILTGVDCRGVVERELNHLSRP